jgi:hypothetical protein
MKKVIKILKIINKHSSFSFPYLKKMLSEAKGDLSFFLQIVIISYSKNFEEVLIKTKDIDKIKKSSIFFPLKAIRMKAFFYTNNDDYIKLYDFLHKNIKKIPQEARYFVEILMKEIEVNSSKIESSKLLLNIEKSSYMKSYKLYYLVLIEFNNQNLNESKKNLDKSFILAIKNNNPDIAILSLLKLYEITNNNFYFNRALEYAFYSFELSEKLSYYYNLFIDKTKDMELKCINIYLMKSIKKQKTHLLFNKKKYPNEIDIKRDFNINEPIYKFAKKIGISRVTLSNIIYKKIDNISSTTINKIMWFYNSEKFNYIVHSEFAKKFIENNKLVFNPKLIKKYLSFYLSMEFFSQDYDLLSKEMINLLNNKLNYKTHNKAKLELSFFFYIDRVAPLKSLFKLYTSFLRLFDEEGLKYFFKKFFLLENIEKRVLTKFIRYMIRFKSLEIDIKREFTIPKFSKKNILQYLNFEEDELYKPFSLLEEDEKIILLDIVSKNF